MQAFDQHVTVLLEEAINALNVHADGVYLDGTYGRGGHARRILTQLGSSGRLLAIDRDPQAVQAATALCDDRLLVKQCPFSGLVDLVRTQTATGQIDGILLDLGVCSPQLADPERGFSFLQDGPLDMRMDPTTGLPAAVWLNKAASTEIATVLKNFGEERFAKRIANAIVAYRARQPLIRTRQLADLIKATVPYHEHNKHAATRSFQAIRIYVNDELGELQRALAASLQVLAPAGRLVVISFHSLEDRLVKRFMQQYSQAAWVPPTLPLTEGQRRALPDGRPLLRSLGRHFPSVQEVAANPQARSAVLRIAERLPDEASTR